MATNDAATSVPSSQMERRSIKGIDIPNWNGDPEIDQLGARGWTQRIDICKKIGNWDSQLTAQYAGMALRGPAGIWYQGLLEQVPQPFEATNWENNATQKGMKAKFLAWFDYEVTLADRAAIIQDLTQRSDEKVKRFYDRCVTGSKNLITGLPELPNVPTVTTSTKDTPIGRFIQDINSIHENAVYQWTLQNTFLQGLKDELKQAVISQNPKDLEELIQSAINAEKAYDAVDKKVKPKVPPPEIHSIQASPEKTPESDKLEELVSLIKGLRPSRGGFRGRGSNRGRGRGSNRTNSSVVCYYCNKPGHLSPDCRMKAQDMQRGINRPNHSNKWATDNQQQRQVLALEYAQEQGDSYYLNL